MSFSAFIHRVAWNFFDTLWRRINNFRLKNKTFTLFSNDCIGGGISHNCGVRFGSPTINLFFSNIEEYVIFWEHVLVYKTAPIIEDPSIWNYPVGILKNSEFGDIHIHFMHYETFDDAVNAWNRRCDRIDLENAYAILHLTRLPENYENILSRFSNLPFKGKCLISWPNILPEDFS